MSERHEGYNPRGGRGNRGFRSGPSEHRGGNRGGQSRGAPSGDQGPYNPRRAGGKGPYDAGRAGGQDRSRGGRGGGAWGCIPTNPPSEVVEMAALPPVPPEPLPQSSTSFAPPTATESSEQQSGNRGKGRRKGRGSKSQTAPEGHSRTDDLSKQMETVSIAEFERKGHTMSQSIESKFKFDEGKMLPTRPNFGTLGRKVMVEVNCWDIEVADFQIHRYDIQPEELQEVTEKGVKILKSEEKYLRKFMKLFDDSMGDDVFSDGGRIYYSLEPLERKFDLSKSQYLAVQDGGKSLRLKYVIRNAGKISAQPIKQYLENPRSRTFEIPQDSINMLDNLFRWVNKKSFDIFKSGVYYRDPDKINPNSLLSIYKGFSFSVRAQWKLRANVDLSFKAAFPAGNLADILYNKYDNRMYDRSQWQIMAKDITSLKVEANHYTSAGTGRAYSKKFTIHGISDKTADEIIIKEKNMSITKYFKEQYGKVLSYPDLPCVRTKKDREEYLPMELLTVVPYQKPKIDKGIVASEIIRVAAVKPSERFRDLGRLITQLVSSQNSLMSRINLKFTNPQPIRVEARELPQPTGQFPGCSKELKRGAWNQEPFFKAATASTPLKWVIVVLPPFRVVNVETLRRKLPNAAKKLGLVMDSSPDVIRINTPELPSFFEDRGRKGIQLAVCVLSNVKIYPEVKRASELNKFMITQCVKDETISKPRVMDNLLLKINGKLGGVNWQVKDLSNWWGEEIVMVVGADVTHPNSERRDIEKSVAAVVASISPDLMKYVAAVRQQEHKVNKESGTHRENIDEMEDIFSDLLKAFGKHNNGRLPTKVFFYRDGVSEGEFYTVLELELAAIQRACTGIRPGYEPGITFIVVQKRHKIRFNPIGGRSPNVSPGTVVDKEITHKREFGFYLCSQQGIQGTSKPASYKVLYDDNNWDADDLQLFSYFLCHVYMRCNRSVSYPAPTYYAHLAAFRARDWLKDAPNPAALLKNNKFTIVEGLQDFMYFL